MDGEWAEIKAKKPKKKVRNDDFQSNFTGGRGKKGELIAGAVQESSNHFGGGGDHFGNYQQSNAASHIADVADDYGGEDFYGERQNIELVSSVCAQQISEARLNAKMTQVDLAKKVGEKTSVIVDIENGSAPYNGGQISNIERALGVKVNRGRKKHRGGKK